MQILGLISDILLLGATGGMAVWCIVLSRRQASANDLDSKLRETIAGLELRVEGLKAECAEATARTAQREISLNTLIVTADDRIGRLEILLASLDDLEAEAANRLQSATPEPGSPLPSFRASRPVGRNQEVRQ